MGGVEANLKVKEGLGEVKIGPKFVQMLILASTLPHNKEKDEIDFRQYAISVTPVGVSKSIKSLLLASSSSTRKIPNIGKVEDISEFIKDEAEPEPANPEATNPNSDVEVKIESETEPASDKTDKNSDVKVKIETDDEGMKSGMSDAENDNVALSQNIGKKGGNIANEKSKIVLTEYGPRMTLKLVKVQEGVNDGEVIYHNYLTRTEEEVMRMNQEKLEKKELKQKRKAQQEANVQRKKIEKEKHKEKSLEGMRKKKEADEKAKQEAKEEGENSEGEEEEEASESGSGSESSSGSDSEDEVPAKVQKSQ